MSATHRYYRTFAIAGCLPYVAWCVLGQWIHGLTGCCEAQPHLHAVVAAHTCSHAHQHSHAPCDSAAAPTDGAQLAEGRDVHVHACPFCDFAGQAQTIDFEPAAPSISAANDLAALPIAPLLSELRSADHPGRGPPQA